MKKEEVYKFSNKVRLLLKSLEGVTITGDEYKLKQISRLNDEIKNEVDEFSPSFQEEYSTKVKYLYKSMIESRKNYENLKHNGSLEEIKAALVLYKNESIKYENAKMIRNNLKEI
ncbi:MAG: hypothetical protein RSA57_03840 [Cetobacterium sp.]|uniref:IPT/TIG domain containing protein n=1 Tax=Bacteria TaxID=2 RepID=UPI002FCB895D